MIGRRGVWPAVLIALAGLAAYADSLSGPFISDDRGSIAENRSIRHFATAFRPDHGSGQTVEARPVLNLSLAFNYALGGTRPRGYHLANVLIHILAGLALFGLIRRTLQLPSLHQRFGEDATWLAGSIALLWTTHPLQTESVTYVVQRAESLMGLFFLFTFYCFVRSVESARPRLWRGLCVASFLLGCGTKEVMVAALPLLLLYDVVFVSGSLKGAWRSHRGVFAALACCLVFPAALIASSGGNRSGSAGFGVGASPLAYALTQPEALLTYIRLGVLPAPLVFEYGTFWSQPGWPLLLRASGVLVLLILTVVALKRAPALGFLGAWFFVILAPTSLVPGTVQMIVEHRMYLPLAALMTLAALGLHRLLGKAGFPVLLALAAVLGWLTSLRNEAYHSEEAIWRDSIAHRPKSDRAHYGLGNFLESSGRAPEAIAEYEAALRLNPDYAEAHNNLGNALGAEGRTAEAIAHLEEALRLKPDFAEAHDNLGNALNSGGRTAEATAQYREALRLKPDFAEAFDGLGSSLARAGQTADSEAAYEAALRIRPESAETHYNLGITLTAEGRTADAIVQYEQAARLKPDFAEPRNNLGIALNAEGRTAEALALFREALRIKPDYADARNNLGMALFAEGRISEAIAQFREALRLRPDSAEARNNLSIALERAGRTGP